MTIHINPRPERSTPAFPFNPFRRKPEPPYAKKREVPAAKRGIRGSCGKLAGMTQETPDLLSEVKRLLVNFAQIGRVCTYDSLLARPPISGMLAGGRPELYSVLDAINDETRHQDYLLSAVVIGDHGMPGTGFFRKLRCGQWPRPSRKTALLSARKTDLSIFREELRRVFDEFLAPRNIAAFIDLENLTQVQDGVISAIDELRKNFRDENGRDGKVLPFGFFHAANKTETSTGLWKEKKLRRIGNLQRFPAHKDASAKTSAADTVLVGKWSAHVEEGFPIYRSADAAAKSAIGEIVILTPRDIICLFADDTMYHAPVLHAIEAGFEVWGFGDGDKKKDKRENRLDKFRGTLKNRGRFFDLRSSESWDFTMGKKP